MEVVESPKEEREGKSGMREGEEGEEEREIEEEEEERAQEKDSKAEKELEKQSLPYIFCNKSNCFDLSNNPPNRSATPLLTLSSPSSSSIPPPSE